MKNRYLLICILILIFSCHKKQEKSIPAKYRTFVKATFELEQLREQIESDSVYTDSARAILIRYGYDQESFQKLMDAFEADPEKWNTFLAALEVYKKKQNNDLKSDP